MADPVPQPLAAPGQASPAAGPVASVAQAVQAAVASAVAPAPAPNPAQDQKLLASVQRGDIDGVRAALAAGADVNTRLNFYEETPLYRAVTSHVDFREKMYPIIDLLLEKGANVNAQRRHDRHTPFTMSFHDPKFFYALFQKRPDLTLKIKEPPEDREETPFQYATRRFAARPEKRYVANVIAKAELGEWDGAIAIARQEAGIPAPASPVASVAQAVQAAVGAVAAPAAPAAPANPVQDARLMDGIIGEDIADVTAALDAGANPNYLDVDSGFTALGSAVFIDSTDNPNGLPIIRLLLSRGANVNMVNADSDTPLHHAADRNNVPVIDILLEAGADLRARNDDRWTPREVAHHSASSEAETRLAAAEAANPAPLAAAAQAVQAAVGAVVAPAAAPAAPAAPARVPNPEQDHALHLAVDHDDPDDDDDDAARAAILAGADPNLMLHGDRETILMHYAGTDNREMVEFLLAHGADVNARAGPAADEPGSTVMNYTSDPDMRAIILRAAAARARGEPPRPATTGALFVAIRRRDLDAVRDLIARGVDVNAPEEDADRTTPIQAAAALDNRFDILQLLVQEGADPAATDAHGVNALEETRRGYAYGNRRFLTERFPDLTAGDAVSRPVLSGRDDLKIRPIWVRDDYRSAMTEGVDWEVIDIPEIFVAKLGRDLTLEQFFRKYMGDGIVFKVGAKFYGVERKDLMQEYSEGSAIAYECTKTFIYNPTAVPPMYGTFEYSDIYATPYFALRTPAGVFYTDLLGMVDILSRPHAFYKVNTNPVKKLENVASRSSVLAGGPVVSQLHCQAGSSENMYEISPFRLPATEDDEEESDEEEKEPNVVFVKKGEEKTEFPLDLAQTVLQLKEAVNARLGIAIESQKMLFQGKVLQDAQTLGEANVKKGYTIQLQVSGGRLTKKRSSRRGGRTVKQKRGTYKRHGRR